VCRDSNGWGFQSELLFILQWTLILYKTNHMIVRTSRSSGTESLLLAQNKYFKTPGSKNFGSQRHSPTISSISHLTKPTVLVNGAKTFDHCIVS
jgi:hypothetical protein